MKEKWQVCLNPKGSQILAGMMVFSGLRRYTLYFDDKTFYNLPKLKESCASQIHYLYIILGHLKLTLV